MTMNHGWRFRRQCIEVLGVGTLRRFHPSLVGRQLDDVLELDRIELALQMLRHID